MVAKAATRVIALMAAAVASNGTSPASETESLTSPRSLVVETLLWRMHRRFDVVGVRMQMVWTVDYGGWLTFHAQRENPETFEWTRVVLGPLDHGDPLEGVYLR